LCVTSQSLKSMIRAYYHIHLTDDPLIWTSIFLEQMKVIEDSGLNTQIDKMKVTCISQDDDRIGMFVRLCESYNIPMELTAVKNPFDNDRDMLYNRNTNKSCTEDITLKRIYEDCKTEDMKVLYFHSKGSTSYSTNVNVNNIVKHKEYFYWRSFMNWAVLRNWQFCENALNSYDIAGGDYHTEPSPHFCGNFWWATSNHIRQLPDPIDKAWWHKLQERTTDAWIKQAPVRMYDEMWIGAREGIKAYDVVKLEGKSPVNQCLTKIDCERSRA
jgi:hypothetical protein